MKKLSLLLAAIGTISMLNAETPAPLADVTFTGGDLKAIKDAAGKSKVTVGRHTGEISWVDDNGEKVIFFNGDYKVPHSTLNIFAPAEFDCSKPWTVYLKVKVPADVKNNIRNQICQYGYGADKVNGFSIFLFNRTLHCRYGYDSKTTVSGNNKIEPVQPDSWVDIVVVHDCKSIALYVNGKLVSKPNNAAVPPTKNSFSIGASAADRGYQFCGMIKNFKLYNQALTAEEVAGLK